MYIYYLIIHFFEDFLIGYGAFGVIWAVTDPRTSRRVALKKMPNVFQSVVAARRAFREIKMLCTFRHDNVIEYINLFFLIKIYLFFKDFTSC
jgi:nemo like kinase